MAFEVFSVFLDTVLLHDTVDAGLHFLQNFRQHFFNDAYNTWQNVANEGGLSKSLHFSHTHQAPSLYFSCLLSSARVTFQRR
jgi:hypothetical protein